MIRCINNKQRVDIYQAMDIISRIGFIKKLNAVKDFTFKFNPIKRIIT